MMDNEKEWESFKSRVAHGETMVKLALCEFVEEHGQSGADKIALLATISRGIWSATIAAAIEALEERDEKQSASFVMGIAKLVLFPEMQKLAKLTGVEFP